MTRGKAIDRIKGWKESEQDFIDHPYANQSTHFTETMLKHFRQNIEIYDMCIDCLEARTTAQWIEDGYNDEPCVCSRCGQPGKYEWWFCPNCGAEMEEE